MCTHSSDINECDAPVSNNTTTGYREFRPYLSSFLSHDHLALSSASFVPTRTLSLVEEILGGEVVAAATMGRDFLLIHFAVPSIADGILDRSALIPILPCYSHTP